MPNTTYCQDVGTGDRYFLEVDCPLAVSAALDSTKEITTMCEEDVGLSADNERIARSGMNNTKHEHFYLQKKIAVSKTGSGCKTLRTESCGISGNTPTSANDYKCSLPVTVSDDTERQMRDTRTGETSKGAAYGITTLNMSTTIGERKSESLLPIPSVDEATISNFEPLMNVIDKLAGGQRVPPQITMQYEMLRFCTLRSYPKVNKPFITRIAQAGFYFANSGDELVCYCCGRRRSNWTETDVPSDVHRKMNPNCKFLLQNAEVNVPIKPNQSLCDRITNSCGKTGSFAANGTGSASARCSELSDTTKTGQPRAETSSKIATSRKQDSNSNVKSLVYSSPGSSPQSEEQANRVQCTSKTTSTEVQQAQQKQLLDTNGASLASAETAIEHSSLKKFLILETKKLQKENEKMRQQSVCSKCKKKDVCVIFLPCGHLVTCEECAPTVKYCCIQGCGKYIKGTVRAYMA